MARSPAPPGIVRPAGVPDDAIMRVLRVPPEAAGMRIDRFVQSQLRNTSRTRSQLIIEASAYSPAGERLRKNRRLLAEERIVLWRPALDEGEAPTRLPVVFEDEHLLAIDKPPHLTVHPTARHHRATVVKVLAAERPDEHVTLLHRLDRETSGVLLLARTREADRAVKIQFEHRRDVLKQYLALTWGWPEWSHHTCDLPLEPDPQSRYRVKMRVAATAPTDATSSHNMSEEADTFRGYIRQSSTTFEVLGRRQRADGQQRYTLLRCTLHTGRQHQIRVHLAALGLPVVGDKLYGPDEDLFARGADDELTPADLDRLELPRHALHAATLEIDHPATAARLRIEAPFPPDLDSFWNTLAPA
jgi:23S rRNA pseudouridine1911/1915/1917 synthase